MNDRTILHNRPALTFAGSPLDRGDLIRRDPDRLVAASQHADARCILLRAGEPAGCVQVSFTALDEGLDEAEHAAEGEATVVVGQDAGPELDDDTSGSGDGRTKRASHAGGAGSD